MADRAEGHRRAELLRSSFLGTPELTELFGLTRGAIHHMRAGLCGPKLPAPVYTNPRFNVWATSDIVAFLEQQGGRYGEHLAEECS
jgi:predicted DNA-binding transcriptional regulator AlpA